VKDARDGAPRSEFSMSESGLSIRRTS